MTQQKKAIAQSNRLAPVAVFATILLLLFVAGLLAAALFSYQPTDPAWSHNGTGVVQNALGVVGAWYSDLSFSLIGHLSYLLPLTLLAFGVHAWLEKGIDKELLSWRLFMLLTAILSGSVLWAAHDTNAINTISPTGGGYVGGWLFDGLKTSIKSQPVIMGFSLLIFVASISLLFNIPWVRIAEWIGSGISRVVGLLFHRFAAVREKKQPVVNAMKSGSSAAAESVVDEDLQQKINAVNALAKQNNEQNSGEKRHFTIDRYEPDNETTPDEDITLNGGDIPLTTAIQPKSTESVQIAEPTPQPIEPQLMPNITPVATQDRDAEPQPRRQANEPVDLTLFGISNPRPAKSEVTPQTAVQQPPVVQESIPAPQPQPQAAESQTVAENKINHSPNTTQNSGLSTGLNTGLNTWQSPLSTATDAEPREATMPTGLVAEEQPLVFPTMNRATEAETETDNRQASAGDETADNKAEPSFFNFDTVKSHVKVKQLSPQNPSDFRAMHQDVVAPPPASTVTAPVAPVAQAVTASEMSELVAESMPEITQTNEVQTTEAPSPIAQPTQESAPQPQIATAPVAAVAAVSLTESMTVSSTSSTATAPSATTSSVATPVSGEYFSLADSLSQQVVARDDSDSIAFAADLSDTIQNAQTAESEAVVQQPATAPITSAPTPPISQASIGKAYDAQAEAQAMPAEPEKTPRHYTLPSIDLLDTPPPQENAYTEDTLAEMAGVLETTLKQFNINAIVMHVSPGPVITRFELDLAPGIQAKKITNLSQDLARALAVSRVRVEEVIPGSSYVGLEVPNKQRQIVYFKDVVRSKAFRGSQSPLTISLGSDTSGKPVSADLMKMPHALVAGTTGSGKSVCINVMLLSMLYKASPLDLRLILVDPKMLEMSMYEDIPHLLTPVITDMNEAENALTWAVGEMERRYQLMAALKVRKIDAFNEHVDEANARGEPIKDPLWEPDESVGYTHHPTLERLPFIVIVIDELADMMMVVGKQVEQLIARLTQKARAAGIHVVLATQRPSTDVLTGLIKANVPTRIAFQVSSGTDSRVIIDGVGAEKLLGHGDMLYVPPGASHPQRLHGAFVGDAETDRITDYLRSLGEPDYIDGITTKQDPESLGAFGAAEAAEAKEDADPLYEEAVQIVLQTGKASISSVQRQLRIGYNRAARMIEDMQDQGIVSEPVNGVRKVLAAPPPKEPV